MHRKKIWRMAALFLSLLAFGFVSAAYHNRDISTCMGVPVLSKNEYAEITEYIHQDLSDVIMLDGYPAAIDRSTNTIYVSQDFSDKNHWEFDGRFSSADNNIKLYFAPDENFACVEEKAKEGYSFGLVASVSDKGFVKYNVVFTNLPVVNMTGVVTGVKKAGEFDANGDRDIYSGTVSVWDGKYESTGKYSAKSGTVQWNQRGNSTFRYDKKSWKLNFKDDKGNNADMDFIGQDADDDWILNAMARDDTLLREKVVMDLWNSGAAQENYNYKMSSSKYAEVVTNGEYMGIYLLQRRLDAKYLGLDNNTHLAKGGKGHISYEPVDTADREATIQLLEQLRTGENVKYLNVDNWIDNSLFIDAFYMADNASRYNTYYIIKDIYTQPQIFISLWDTDFSFGIGYSGNFIYQPEMADVLRRNKDELYQLAEIHPEIYDEMSNRWAELRSGVLSTENVLDVMAANHNSINKCGAFGRDDVKWPNEYDDTDTYEAMCKYVETRLAYLDECYAKGDIIRETGDTVPGK